MAARPIWRGQIRLALVRSRSSSIRRPRAAPQIQFHQIHEPSGKRIKYEKVVPGIGPVDRDDIVKGYEVSKGNYVLLDQEEIEASSWRAARRSTSSSSSMSATSTRSISTSPIIVVPADDLAEEAFVVLREALQGREEGRRRPAGDARAGICRRAEAVRARHAAGDAALRRRGQQGAGLFPRDRRCQARRRFARPRRDADRAEGRRVRPRASSTTAMSMR